MEGEWEVGVGGEGGMWEKASEMAGGGELCNIAQYFAIEKAQIKAAGVNISRAGTRTKGYEKQKV